MEERAEPDPGKLPAGGCAPGPRGPEAQVQRLLMFSRHCQASCPSKGEGVWGPRAPATDMPVGPSSWRRPHSGLPHSRPRLHSSDPQPVGLPQSSSWPESGSFRCSHLPGPSLELSPQQLPCFPFFHRFPASSLWGQCRSRYPDPLPGVLVGYRAPLRAEAGGARRRDPASRRSKSKAWRLPSSRWRQSHSLGGQLSSAALQASRTGHLPPAFPLSPSFPNPPCVHPILSSGVAAHTLL